MLLLHNKQTIQPASHLISCSRGVRTCQPVKLPMRCTLCSCARGPANAAGKLKRTSLRPAVELFTQPCGCGKQQQGTLHNASRAISSAHISPLPSVLQLLLVRALDSAR
jgi:hypothetical protein